MLLVHIFVKFGYNYPNPKEFINYICGKTGKNYLKEHLRGKFNQIYDDYGSHADTFIGGKDGRAHTHDRAQSHNDPEKSLFQGILCAPEFF